MTLQLSASHRHHNSTANLLKHVTYRDSASRSASESSHSVLSFEKAQRGPLECRERIPLKLTHATETVRKICTAIAGRLHRLLWLIKRQGSPTDTKSLVAIPPSTLSFVQAFKITLPIAPCGSRRRRATRLRLAYVQTLPGYSAFEVRWMRSVGFAAIHCTVNFEIVPILIARHWTANRSLEISSFHLCYTLH